MKHPVRFALPLLLPFLIPLLPASGLTGVQGTAHLHAQELKAEWVPSSAAGSDFPLSVRSIMQGPEVVGESPTSVRWTDDGSQVYFRWRPGGGEWHEERSLHRVPREGGEPERIDEAAADTLEVYFADGDLSRNRRWRVSSIRGDLYLVERSTLEATRLTRTTADERDPRFSGDGERIFFTRDGNLFAMDRGGAGLEQLTDIREGPPPEDDEEASGHRAFLEEQQEELFEHVRVRKLRQEREEEREERRKAERPEPLYLEDRERVRDLHPSPDGSRVAFVLETRAADARETMVPEWVNEAGYTEPLGSRPKVGDEQSSYRVGILEVETGEVTWLDVLDGVARTGEEAGKAASSSEENGPERRSDPEGPERTAERASDPEKDENAYPDLARVHFAGWSDDGAHGLFFAVPFDFKSWKLWSVDGSSHELTLLDSLQDSAWVNGPCFASCVGWIPDSRRAWYVSEATGYAHLYSVEADGSGRRALTSGEWEVHDVSIPEDRSRFHLRTNEGTPFEQHAWRMEFDGSDRTRITRGAGHFAVTPSSDGERLAVVHSHADRPPELSLADAGDGVELEPVTTSPTEEWRSFDWHHPEIVRFEARDGTAVPARIYRPADLGAEPNGAAVIFVHGAGYLQNVHHWWSSYYREYMFHHILAAAGFVVLDIDYRGSAGYGRDWRTAIYRHMGGWDLTDQVDGARYLVESEGVDPGRIGIYGGSYGGFITLMALFTADDTFRSGAALRSVTDWAHYSHGYTSRILNLPHQDEEAYRQSSPIYFAEGFRNDQHLLILHPMVDVNVHFQDVVRLAQRLIELGKENWEMAVYPVEDHGFVEPSSWTDEYRRILELFQETLGGPNPWSR